MKSGHQTISILPYAARESGNASSEDFSFAVGSYHSGEYDVAIVCLQKLSTQTPEKSIEYLEVLRLLAFCKQASGDLVGAENCALSIQRLAELQSLSAWVGHALVQLAAVSRDKGHAGYGVDLSRRAKYVLRDTEDFIGLSRACYELGYCLLQEGNLRGAREELETATTLAGISSDPLTEALAARRLGFCLIQQSEFALARAAYERALRVFETMECKWRAGQVIYGLIVLEICLGNLLAARNYVALWDDVYEGAKSIVRVSRWRLLKGWLLVSEGNAIAALDCLQRAKEIFEDLGIQRDAALCWEFIGDARGLLGEDLAALESYDESIAWGRRVSLVADVVLESMRKRGEVLSRQGNLPAGVLQARRALPLTRIYSEPLEQAALLRLRGILKVQRGRQIQGMALLEEAWALFSKIGATIEAALPSVS